MEKKFEKLFESTYQRYQRFAGLLAGDYVKFTDKFKSLPEYKELTDAVKEKIESMIDSGLNLRVTDVKSYYPNSMPENDATSGYMYVIDIAIDQGGGRYSDYMCIPATFVSVIDVYPNLMGISPKRDIKTKVNIKPEELESDEKFQSNLSDTQGKGKLAFGDRKLNNKNVVIPSKPAAPSTAVYMMGM